MEIYLPDGIKIPFKLSFVCLLLSVTDAAVPRSARANAAFQIPVPCSCVQADICRFHAPIADLQISPRVQTHQPYKHCFSVSSFSPFGSGHPEQGGAFSSDPTRASSAEVSVTRPGITPGAQLVFLLCSSDAIQLAPPVGLHLSLSSLTLGF